VLNLSQDTPAGAVDSNHWGIDVDVAKSSGRYYLIIDEEGGQASNEGWRCSGVGY